MGEKTTQKVKSLCSIVNELHIEIQTSLSDVNFIVATFT